MQVNYIKKYHNYSLFNVIARAFTIVQEQYERLSGKKNYTKDVQKELAFLLRKIERECEQLYDHNPKLNGSVLDLDKEVIGKGQLISWLQDDALEYHSRKEVKNIIDYVLDSFVAVLREDKTLYIKGFGAMTKIALDPDKKNSKYTIHFEPSKKLLDIVA